MPTDIQTRATVSVVVPCYNVESCVERSLESALSQSYQDLCVLAIDDGSTDTTPRVLEKYAGRIVCDFGSHAGQAAARNRGIRLSQSRYVAFLDADDEWLPEKLARQIAVLEEHPEVGMICSACVAGPADPSQRNASRDRTEAGAEPMIGRMFDRLIQDCFVFTPTVVVRRECLDQVGLFDESLAVSEDLNLWLRIAARWDIAFLPQALAVRHSRPTSLSSTADYESRIRDGIEAVHGVHGSWKWLTEREQKLVQSDLARRNYHSGSCYLWNGQNQKARKPLWFAWTRQPTNWRALTKLALSFLPASVFQEIRKAAGRVRARPAKSAAL